MLTKQQLGILLAVADLSETNMSGNKHTESDVRVIWTPSFGFVIDVGTNMEAELFSLHGHGATIEEAFNEAVLSSL